MGFALSAPTLTACLATMSVTVVSDSQAAIASLFSSASLGSSTVAALTPGALSLIRSARALESIPWARAKASNPSVDGSAPPTIICSPLLSCRLFSSAPLLTLSSCAESPLFGGVLPLLAAALCSTLVLNIVANKPLDALGLPSELNMPFSADTAVPSFSAEPVAGGVFISKLFKSAIRKYYPFN